MPYRVNVTAEDKDGALAIHWAARGGQLDTVKLLLAAGSPVLPTDGQGNTPLHGAAAGGHQEVVTYLLKAQVCVGDDRRWLTMGRKQGCIFRHGMWSARKTRTCQRCLSVAEHKGTCCLLVVTAIDAVEEYWDHYNMMLHVLAAVCVIRMTTLRPWQRWWISPTTWGGHRCTSPASRASQTCCSC